MPTLVSPSSGAALASIRSLLAAERSTYHVFSYRGDDVLYDLCSGTLLQLLPAVAALLHGVEERATDEAIQASVAGVGELDLERTLAELRDLQRLGLFRLEDPPTEEERRRTIAALEAHSQRNLMLLVHTSCNLACSYCYEVQSGFHHTGGGMPFARAREILEDYLERGRARESLTVTFFGGEPLLSFETIRAVVDYGLERGRELGKTLRWSLTTNGTLLTPEVVAFLVQHEFAVMVSIDGPPERADVHRRTLSGRGTTRKAIRHAQALIAAQRAAGVREASIRATLTEENPSRVAVHEYLSALGFRRIMIGESIGQDHHRSPWDLSQATLGRLHAEHDHMIVDHLAALQRGGTSLYSAGMAQSTKRAHDALHSATGRNEVRCGVGRNMLAVSATGDMYPCHRFAGDKAFVVGNVTRGGVDRERLATFYEGILDAQQAECSKCWARFLCGGRCPWHLARPDGTIAPPDQSICNHLRTGFEKQLWTYKESLTNDEHSGRRNE